MTLRQPDGLDHEAAAALAQRPPSWKVWWLAVRPKTLVIAVAPVLAGSSLALADTGGLRWPPLLLALLGAVAIQAGTNLQNDAGDFRRGADPPDRLGPRRVTAAGWASPHQVQGAALLAFGLAAAAGLYLVTVGGWPILVLGLLSIAAGLAYTAGPRPLAYTALGELLVFLFFGLGAVMGSYYLQTLRLTWPAVFVASGIGLLAAAVLTVNNFRDMESDRRAGRVTLAHRLGRRRTRALYVLLMTLPYLLLALLPWSASLSWRFCTRPPSPLFNRLLAETAQLLLAYAVLLGLGLTLV